MKRRPEIDWHQASSEAIEHFTTLLKIDTSNPPGDVSAAVTYVQQVLEREGIPTTVVEQAPGKLAIAARLKGQGGNGGVVLDAHLDVVPAKDQLWTRPPFGGQVIDGSIWGRGALDMKHMAAMSMMCLILMKRHNVRLEGDLALLLTPDEEVGARGIQWIAAHHPELMEGEYALGEVGGISMNFGDKRVYPIQVAEKGIIWVRVKVKGASGHGSIPTPENATVKAAAIVAKIAGHRFPIQPNEPVSLFLDAMGKGMGFPASAVIKLAKTKAFGHFVLNRFPDKKKAAALKAMLSDTANPTVIKSSNNVNVVSEETIIELDCRILPGTTTERFLARLKELIGPEHTVEVFHSQMGSYTSHDNPFYRTIKQTVERMDPGAEVVPYMITGFTNGHAYLNKGIKYMGFTPITMPKGLEFNQLFHAPDERCPVDGFRWGTRTLFETLFEHLA
jgi:acetylornithine deacetylase/succinyl-diaminopimelate desuccinylase-like protein